MPFLLNVALFQSKMLGFFVTYFQNVTIQFLPYLRVSLFLEANNTSLNMCSIIIVRDSSMQGTVLI